MIGFPVSKVDAMRCVGVGGEDVNHCCCSGNGFTLTSQDLTCWVVEPRFADCYESSIAGHSQVVSYRGKPTVAELFGATFVFFVGSFPSDSFYSSCVLSFVGCFLQVDANIYF